MKTLGILLFDDVELLDFAGPFEVFSLAEKEETGEKLFSVVTVTQTGQSIQAMQTLKVTPNYSFENCPRLDILLIPGGRGARNVEIHNHHLLEWIATKAAEVKCILSVCTGSLILAELGLLNGRKATTHWASIAAMQANYPKITVLKNIRFVDEGSIMTSAGISAGIDLSLHYIEKSFGSSMAQKIVDRMEYDPYYR